MGKPRAKNRKGGRYKGRRGIQTLTHPARIEGTERQIEAVNLRRTGMSYPQIGQQMGISYQAAFKLVTTAIRNSLQESVDDVRKMELERLDLMEHAILPLVLKDKDLQALNGVLRIMARRAALMGLDVQVPVSSSDVDDRRIEIQEVLKDGESHRAILYLERRINRPSESSGDGPLRDVEHSAPRP